jgi:hypothetical protein
MLFSIMFHSADLVFHHDWLVFFNDESSSSHEHPKLKVLVFFASRLEGQVRDCSLNQLEVYPAQGAMGSRQLFPNGVDLASGLPPRTAPNAGVISTIPV